MSNCARTYFTTHSSFSPTSLLVFVVPSLAYNSKCECWGHNPGSTPILLSTLSLGDLILSHNCKSDLWADVKLMLFLWAPTPCSKSPFKCLIGILNSMCLINKLLIFTPSHTPNSSFLTSVNYKCILQLVKNLWCVSFPYTASNQPNLSVIVRICPKLYSSSPPHW